MLIRKFSQTILFVILICNNAFSQSNQTSAEKPEPSMIFVGQSVANAKNSLEAQNIVHGEGGFAISKTDPDQFNLFAILDDEHISVCIFYSKKKSQVTDLFIIFKPSKKSGRVNHFWMSAKKIVLNQDGSYWVHFDPPAPLEPNEKDE
ncbi:hypothetical protein [uncultured Rubinisphaera sp.]|uniref:hypothetical protein n=1 Tax=uncultured Rubinisphaera sp. TaxID=1678686 RepID=UPI0030DA8C66|tara:strand:- start:316 stop:759 length:444 start_codon:yes stop_codon:yes gene_type:complete